MLRKAFSRDYRIAGTPPHLGCGGLCLPWVSQPNVKRCCPGCPSINEQEQHKRDIVRTRVETAEACLEGLRADDPYVIELIARERLGYISSPNEIVPPRQLIKMPPFIRGCSSMVERQLPKLDTGVRFPSPAPIPLKALEKPLNN